MIKANELSNNSREEIEKIEAKILAKNKEGKKRLLLKSIISNETDTELINSGYTVDISIEDNETIITW